MSLNREGKKHHTPVFNQATPSIIDFEETHPQYQQQQKRQQIPLGSAK